MNDHDDTPPPPSVSSDADDDEATIEHAAVDPGSTLEMSAVDLGETIEMPEISEMTTEHPSRPTHVQPMPPEMVASANRAATSADEGGRTAAADPDTMSIETDRAETSIVESVTEAERVPLVIPVPPEFADTDSLYPTSPETTSPETTNPETTNPETGFAQADRGNESSIVPAAVPQAVEMAPPPASVGPADRTRPGVAVTDRAGAAAPIAESPPGAYDSGARSMPPGALARPAPARRSPIPLIVLALIAAMLLGGGVAAWWVSRESPNDGVESAGTGSATTTPEGVGTQPISTSGPAVGSDTVPTTAGDPPTVATTAPPVTNPPATNPPVTNPPVTNPPVTNPPVTNPPVTTDTVPGDLGLEAPMRRPACDGQFVVITANSVTPGQYAQEVAEAQRTFVGSAYLRTDETCSSLRAYDDLGNAIYSVYYGPFPTLGRACEIRNQVGGESYVKILDQTTPYTKIWDC